MNKIFRRIILVFICLLPFILNAQEAQPKGEKAPATSRAQRKKAKQKWKDSRKIEKEQRKAVKDHHKRLQSKETRKRMRREKRKSERLKMNKKEPKIVRLFKYGHT
ncbi:MAG: hypothetical protein V4608_00365 [Bacteroidota bacterium]